ncbi:hypothetical protein BAE44_0026301 [Dichanthelium oligosanthes]|uniref:Protein kinase domain-containing protein n=1 Tax=Dichanthelium oligosanthes TaxID=888268 RepID=A0A1E5UIH7_9POAL|nr:hypothetical protein BAE44_0026301 [Dichanthelium oligosanthes]
MELTLQFLRNITNDFAGSREIGSDAFGTAYKGVLEDGTMIAVKKLYPLRYDVQHFRHVVINLMAIQHENIVKLLGFCHETENHLERINGRFIIAESVCRLICYEYAPNGNLGNHLSGHSLDWDTRFNIIKGMCKGLHYLHMEREMPILHFES